MENKIILIVCLLLATMGFSAESFNIHMDRVFPKSGEIKTGHLNVESQYQSFFNLSRKGSILELKSFSEQGSFVYTFDGQQHSLKVFNPKGVDSLFTASKDSLKLGAFLKYFFANSRIDNKEFVRVESGGGCETFNSTTNVINNITFCYVSLNNDTFEKELKSVVANIRDQKFDFYIEGTGRY